MKWSPPFTFIYKYMHPFNKLHFFFFISIARQILPTHSVTHKLNYTHTQYRRRYLYRYCKSLLDNYTHIVNNYYTYRLSSPSLVVCVCVCMYMCVCVSKYERGAWTDVNDFEKYNFDSFTAIYVNALYTNNKAELCRVHTEYSNVFTIR